MLHEQRPRPNAMRPRLGALPRLPQRRLSALPRLPQPKHNGMQPRLSVLPRWLQPKLSVLPRLPQPKLSAMQPKQNARLHELPHWQRQNPSAKQRRLSGNGCVQRQRYNAMQN